LPALPPNLWSLSCSGINLTSLPALPRWIEEIDCSYNLLTGIDVRGLTDLDFLDCTYNVMASRSAVLGYASVSEFYFDPQRTSVAPAITTVSLPGGTVGTAYSQTLAAVGLPAAFSWSVASGALPAGLSLSAAGVISGTPTAAGTSSFSVSASNGVGPNATRAFSIAVTGGSISPVTIAHLEVSGLANKTYNAKGQGIGVTPKAGVGAVGTITVKYNGSTALPVNAGTYRVTADVEASTAYQAAKDIELGSYRITQANLSSASVKVTIKDIAWTGKKRAAASFVFNGVSHDTKANTSKQAYKTNTDIGKASVKITGKGNFTGTKTVSFKIVPKANSVSKVAVGKGQITPRWTATDKKQGITKYEVRYKEKGAAKWSKPKAADSSKTSLTITKLKKGKKYDVSVRSYKTVKSQKYYSAWSKTRTSAAVK